MTTDTHGPSKLIFKDGSLITLGDPHPDDVSYTVDKIIVRSGSLWVNVEYIKPYDPEKNKLSGWRIKRNFPTDSIQCLHDNNDMY